MILIVWRLILITLAALLWSSAFAQAQFKVRGLEEQRKVSARHRFCNLKEKTKKNLRSVYKAIRRGFGGN